MRLCEGNVLCELCGCGWVDEGSVLKCIGKC